MCCVCFGPFRFAQEHDYLDWDTFVGFLEALAAASRKSKTNVKELRERLSRCGPPRAPSRAVLQQPKKESMGEAAQRRQSAGAALSGGSNDRV